MSFDRLRRNPLARRLLRPALHATRRIAGRDDPFARRGSLELAVTSPYCSQYGQDRFLHEDVFGDLPHGTFVEIGAHDGSSFSNTLFFERELAWSGLCVEPIPDVFQSLRTLRKATCVQAAVSAREGCASFLRVRGYAEMLSGLESSYDPRHLERVRREVAEHGGSVELEEVATVRLDSLLRRHSIDRVDLLCIDVEGAEMDVLRSFDLSKTAPAVVCIENNYRDPRIWRRLRWSGYRPLARFGPDEIFLHRSAAARPLASPPARPEPSRG